MSDMQTQISVVVPNFNNGATLGMALESVIGQCYPGLELIVVDGGSTDQSLDIIHDFERHLAWWVSEPDRGQAHAINKGFARCTGEVVNWLCSDDRLEPGALERVGRFFADQADVDVLCGACRATTSTGGWRKVFKPALHQIRRMPCASVIQQPSCFYRRWLLDRDPPLDESFQYAMDFELWNYFASRGAHFACIDNVLSIYLASGENKTSTGGARIRREMGRVYRRYTAERVSLLFWHNLLLLPLDYVRKALPRRLGEKLVRPLRILVERLLGRFYGFDRVHAMDWSWTIEN